MTVVAPIDGAAIFAIGEFLPPPPTPWCPYVLGFSESGIAIQANPLPLYDWSTFAWSTWSDPVALSVDTQPHVGVPCNCAGVVFYDHTIACTCVPQPNIAMFDTVSSKLMIPSVEAGVPLEGDPGNPIAPDGFVLSRVVGANYGFDLLSSSGNTSRMIWEPHNIMNVAFDRATSNQLVWVAFDGLGPYSGATLRTAPYAHVLSPSDVTKLSWTSTTRPPGYEMVANAGVVLNVVSDGNALLTRLSDGWGWSIAPDPGDIFIRPLWVDANELGSPPAMQHQRRCGVSSGSTERLLVAQRSHRIIEFRPPNLVRSLVVDAHLRGRVPPSAGKAARRWLWPRRRA